MYQIRFVKTLCDDYGRKHECIQGDVQIHRARTVARALQAAKLKFQRLKKTGHWWTHADDIEVNNMEYGSAGIGEEASTKSAKPFGEKGRG